MGNYVHNNSYSGIRLEFSNNSVIKDNICNSHRYSGINLFGSSDNIIADNNCSDNTKFGHGTAGITLYDKSHDNLIKGNRCWNNPENGIRIHAGSSGNTIQDSVCGSNEYGIAVHGDDNNIINSTVRENDIGVRIFGEGNSFFKCDVENNVKGIYFQKGFDSLIDECFVSNNEEVGIQFQFFGFSSQPGHFNTIIQNNEVSHQPVGIFLTNSWNVVKGNDINHNDVGLHLSGGVNNTITDNEIRNNLIGVNVTYLYYDSWIPENPDLEIPSWNNSILRNQFHDNADFGLTAMDNRNLKVVATYNGWGDDSGPYHSGFNPTGKGDNVSNYVSYDPWIEKEYPSDNCTISGSVKDIYGHPLKGVHISTGCSHQYQANTSDDGSYVIEDFPSRTYCIWTFTASREGFKNVTYRTTIHGDQQINFVLEPEPTNPGYSGQLSGFVYNESGDPLDVTNIWVMCSGFEIGTSTNIFGYYEIENLPMLECLWTVNVSLSGYFSQEIEIGIGTDTNQNFTLLSDSPPPIIDNTDDSSETVFPLPPIVVLSMGVGSFVLILVAFTEFGRYAFFSLLYPLYTRLSKDKLLENYTRGRIHGLIEGVPGIHYSELMRKLGVGNGNLAYHLKTLEREGIIRSRRSGKTKKFYLSEDATFSENNSQSEAELPANPSSLSENPTRISILEHIGSNPGMSESEISEALGIPKQTVNYHIRSQEISGVIRVERENGSTRCFIEKEKDS